MPVPRRAYPVEFVLPALGGELTDGTVLEWLATPGDLVRVGEPLLIVEVGGVAVDVRGTRTGELRETLVSEGDTVVVGAPLALIGPPPPGRPLAPPPVRWFASRAGVDLATVHGSGRDGRITRADVQRATESEWPGARVSTYARRVATELGVDLSTMAGHGPGSFIRVPDIRAAGLPRPSATRQRGGPGMAELVARSKREIPHYHVSRTIDLTVTLEWLRRRPSGGITVAALLVRATALAAVVVPELNGYWTNGRFRPGDGVHVGIAIALPGGGLGTPTIADVPGLDPVDLARRLREVVERARSGGAWAAACVPATITVTDLAADGVDSVHTIIHPPQVAHAGFGGITWRPGAAGARLGIRPQLTATLAADQRTGPPKLGARFLSAIDMLLQRPAELTR